MSITASSYPRVPESALLESNAGAISVPQLERFVAHQLAAVDLDGRSVCLIIPDGTRSCPLPMVMRTLHRELAGRASRMVALIALGTHAPMDDAQIDAMLGCAGTGRAAAYPGLDVVNHAWSEPGTFVTLGTIGSARMSELSEGRLNQEVEVRLNRAVVEHDVVIVVGPVFPHEVVGFSGGNKYFFPGVAGQEVIDVSHWLGALITSREIIGTRSITPVRALIDEAASMIPTERLALCLVVESGSGDLHAVSFGPPETAWERAADIAARTHVRYLDAPVRRVLSIVPKKYEDMWTGAKGFYKVEPVVADGGEVVIWAPHITEISAMHPEIMEVGYHCRDYFLRQWDRFRHLHWGVLAHSTHLRGAGTFDEDRGEVCRVSVRLATGIPREVVEGANLEYLDPNDIDLAAFEADPECLVVPHAGETLFRLRD